MNTNLNAGVNAGADGTGLIDALALWWHEAETCDHHPDDDVCDCWTVAGWDLGYPWGLSVEVAGHRYISDRRLLIREDLLANWPVVDDPGRPLLTDLNSLEYSLGEVHRYLAADVAGPVGPKAGVSFDPDRLDLLVAAGYNLQPLVDERDVHAVVDPTGVRVGVIMPITHAEAAAAAGEASAAEGV